jgi:pimeloyl-ACP methyl ester carboxylesterase
MNVIVLNVIRYLYWRITSRQTRQSGNVCHKQAEIHYITYGTGEPVVLLHGGLSNKLSWFSQIPMLVRSGRQVILIDTRGHVKSTLGKEALSYQLFAEDVLKVLKHLCIQKADFIGWSDGGITALILGQYSPAQVNRIIAISANISPTGLTVQSQKQLGQKIQPFIGWIKKRWTGSKDYLNELEEHIWRIWSSPIMSEIDLSRVVASTLVIVGESDIVTLVHSEKMASVLKNGKLIVINKGGHATPITHASEINALINNFLVHKPFNEEN